jgi:hypothetical protein
MRRFRFKVRTLVLVVAVVGLVLGGVQMRRRVISYRQLALNYALIEKKDLRLHDSLMAQAEQRDFERRAIRTAVAGAARAPGSKDLLTFEMPPPLVDLREEAGRALSSANYNRTLRKIYEWAAEHPWSSVPPDLPAPP